MFYLKNYISNLLLSEFSCYKRHFPVNTPGDASSLVLTEVGLNAAEDHPLSVLTIDHHPVTNKSFLLRTLSIKHSLYLGLI